jgi:SET domain-containing protein
MTTAPTMLRPEPYHANKLAVRRSPLHRWGVFATAKIAAYELLEESPYFLTPLKELRKAPSCETYSYYLDNTTSIIGLGLAGLYNHSSDPNCSHEIDQVNNLMRHYALRPIALGEELTIDYGTDNAAHFMKGGH